MRWRLLTFTCLLSLSIRQCTAIEGPADVAQAARETVGAAQGHSAAHSGSTVEHASQMAHEAPTSGNEDRTLVTQLRSPTFDGEHPNQAVHYGGPPHGHSGSDIYDELAKGQRPSDSSLEAWMQDGSSFRLPRIPPDDEWPIKTWWIEKWRPLSAKLRAGFSRFFSILFFPFSFLNLKPQELKYSPIPLHTLPHQPTPVWEKLPSDMVEGKIQDSWSSRMKKRIGIKSSQKPESETQLNEDIVPASETLKENAPHREAKWKTPKFPPVSSRNPDLIKQYYLLGKDFGQIELPHLESLSEQNSKALNALLNSQESLALARALYEKRNDLMLLHEQMPGIIDEVVNVLGGEKNTRETFRQIIDSYRRNIARRKIEGAQATAIGVDPRKAEFLKMKYPKAYEVHLAPLVLLDEVIREGPAAQSAIRGASGYIGTQSRLELLIGPAEKVTEYLRLIRQVDQIQNKILEARNFATSLTKADFADWPRSQETFLEIVSLKDVN